MFRDLKAILGKSTANFKRYSFNGHIDMNATFPVSKYVLCFYFCDRGLWRLIFCLVLVGACWLCPTIGAFGTHAIDVYHIHVTYRMYEDLPSLPTACIESRYSTSPLPFKPVLFVCHLDSLPYRR